VVAATSLFLGPPALAADSVGATGRIAAIRLNDTKGDEHSQFHGRLDVETGGQLASYFWGGNKCSAFTLNTATVEVLHSALGEPRVVVQPYFQVQGNADCLVGFRMIHRDFQGLY
jgi:hypothetical protein